MDSVMLKVRGPGGTVEVTLRQRDYGDPYGPRDGTIARIRLSEPRMTVPMPDSTQSDHGGPLDQAWAARNEAELDEMRGILTLAKDRVTSRCSGMWPGEWTPSLNAGCSMCTCSPGLVGDQTLTINEHVIDLYITDKRKALRTCAAARMAERWTCATCMS
jgi:hypothetical protein